MSKFVNSSSALHRAALVVVGLTLSTSLGGCGDPLPEEIETESAGIVLTRTVIARPYADAPIQNDSGCCDAPWEVHGGSRRWSAVDEESCNGATDYVSTGSHKDSYPFWAGMAFDLDLSGVPNGAKVSDMSAVVCARPHNKFGKGVFNATIHYWDPEGNGHRYLEGSNGLDYTEVPAVGVFDTNRFNRYPLPARHSASYPASYTGKTSTSGMRLQFRGDNLDVSQIYVTITWPTTTPLPL